MKANNEKYEFISNQTDLDNLISAIKNGKSLAVEFKFTERDYFIALLEALEIDYEEFTKKYYYFDSNRHLHISESEFEYVWISTYGLIAKDKATDNKAVNACVNQYTVLDLILDKAIEICKSEKVYDVDGYNFGELSRLSPALFHNLVFYIEVFCKAYLSLSGVESPKSHKLSSIYSKLMETMYAKKNSDSLFQVYIVDTFAKIVEHVTRIPGNFKEAYIKYDDNLEDTTLVVFHIEHLTEMKNMVDLCHDFILDFFYTGDESFYFKTGLFQRVLERAKTEDQKKRINEMYGHLISNDDKKKM